MPYIGKSTDGFGIRERFTYVVSAGATSISGADANGRTLAFEDPEYVDVFLNGVRLKKDTDYNLNTANTISSLAALAASDEIEVIVNDVFTLADMVSANNGGDFRGNLAIAKDSGVLSFGLDKEITLTHSADAGLILKHANTADDSFPNLLLQTGDTDIAINDVLGSIQFQAPDEGSGTDAILVGAAIQAISEGDFSSSNNATKISFQTGASEAAAEKMSLSSAGVLTVSSNIVSSGTITGGGLLTTGGNIVIPDDGNIGSASDTNAIAISSAGVVTISTNTDATNSTSGALIAHSAGFADDVYVGDGLFVTGAITGSGAVQGTTITATTAFVPDASDGAALGTTSLEFSDLFLADGAVINFGADQDINITHVADTGLTTNGSFTASGTMQGTTITATTAFVPDASDGAALGSATLEFSDLFLADGGEVKFGADQDVLLRHDHNSGLIIDRTNTSDNSPTTLTLQTAETDIQADDVIGTINFQAPDEGTGTDAILVAAGIDAVSEGDFSSSNNATKLVFKTAASETASSKMTLSSAGLLTVADDIVFKDGGTIGVTSAVDAMTVSSGGIVTFKDDILIKDGGTIGNASVADVMTLASTGIVTFKDDILIKDGGTIGSASDADAITISAAGVVTLTQALIGTGLDISGTVDFDGTTNLDVVDIDGAVDMASTLQVDGAITSSAGATITVADNSNTLTLVSTDADANSGPLLDFYRNSGSPADADLIGSMNFRGRNDNSQDVNYGTIIARIEDASDGTEDGRVDFRAIINGAESTFMKYHVPSGNEVVFNDGSLDIDFRVETNNDTHTLFVQGSNDNIGIGTSSPDGELHIEPTAGGTNASLILSNDGRSQYYRVQNNETSDALTFNANDSTQICQITGVNVGIFSTAQTARFNVESNLSSYTCVSLKNNNSNNSGVFLIVTNSSDGACGSISQNGANNALFNTSSDYRLKENITYDWDATTRLKQLKPARFNFIEDDTNTAQDGFLAHEVSDIVPLAIVGDKDSTQDIGTIKDKDGKVLHENVPQARKEEEQTWTKTGTENVYQQIDHSKLVPLLVKTIQELEARIKTLEDA